MPNFHWGGPIDANGYALNGAKIYPVSSFPTATSDLEGVVAYNTTTDTLRVCNGSAWVLPASDSLLLEGSNKAFFQDLANIPNGNLAWARVSGGQAAINATKLNALAAPDGDVDFASHKITGLAAASASTDGVRKSELDAVAVIANAAAAGVAYKNPVRVAASTTISLSAVPAAIDSITMAAGDRFLVAGQGGDIATPHLANGIYVYPASSGQAAVRATDADSGGELAAGTQVVVTEGANGDQPWYLVSDGAVTIGTTAQKWNKLPYPSGEIGVAGLGLTKTGSTYDVGAGTGVSVGADDVGVQRGSGADLTTNGRVAMIKVMDVPAGGTATADMAHGMGYQFVTATIYENTAGTWGEVGGVGVEPYSTSNCRLFFGANPIASQYKVVFHG